MALDVLIESPDAFEVISNKIAVILAEEIADQKAKAIAAGKTDLSPWEARVYNERSNPWEQFLVAGDPLTPIINVWFDTDDTDQQASNLTKYQQMDGVFNVDFYSNGLSSDNPAGGHTPGDKDSIVRLHQAIRLSRQILMSSKYAYLDLRGIVGARKIQSRNVYQPDPGGVQKFSGARMRLNVTYTESAPQSIATTLDELGVTIKRNSDGLVLAEADFIYTE